MKITLVILVTFFIAKSSCTCSPPTGDNKCWSLINCEVENDDQPTTEYLAFMKALNDYSFACAPDPCPNEAEIWENRGKLYSKYMDCITKHQCNPTKPEFLKGMREIRKCMEKNVIDLNFEPNVITECPEANCPLSSRR